MVTAELAACLPVLVLILAFALSVVSVVGARVGVADAAREAARAAARGEQPAQLQDVHVQVSASDTYATATATRSMHLLTSWLPSITITEQATAALEPTN